MRWLNRCHAAESHAVGVNADGFCPAGGHQNEFRGQRTGWAGVMPSKDKAAAFQHQRHSFTSPAGPSAQSPAMPQSASSTFPASQSMTLHAFLY